MLRRRRPRLRSVTSVSCDGPCTQRSPPPTSCRRQRPASLETEPTRGSCRTGPGERRWPASGAAPVPGWPSWRQPSSSSRRSRLRSRSSRPFSSPEPSMLPPSLRCPVRHRSRMWPALSPPPCGSSTSWAAHSSWRSSRLLPFGQRSFWFPHDASGRLSHSGLPHRSLCRPLSAPQVRLLVCLAYDPMSPSWPRVSAFWLHPWHLFRRPAPRQRAPPPRCRNGCRSLPSWSGPAFFAVGPEALSPIGKPTIGGPSLTIVASCVAHAASSCNGSPNHMGARGSLMRDRRPPGGHLPLRRIE